MNLSTGIFRILLLLSGFSEMGTGNYPEGYFVWRYISFGLILLDPAIGKKPENYGRNVHIIMKCRLACVMAHRVFPIL
ncbi:hypothetical protein IMSAGC014_01219 [Bacteroidaceae bacterium]|nr:hypothetical protein IMSAGC014_01219 [Bacteroidaceae bacterium]